MLPGLEIYKQKLYIYQHIKYNMFSNISDYLKCNSKSKAVYYHEVITPPSKRPIIDQIISLISNILVGKKSLEKSVCSVKVSEVIFFNQREPLPINSKS